MNEDGNKHASFFKRLNSVKDERGGNKGRKEKEPVKALLDTCVLLDFHMDREGFAEDAESILVKAVNQEIACFLTPKSACDLFYVYRKDTKDAHVACKRINDLLSMVSLLDTTKEDVQKALELSYTNDFEDGIKIETSIREKMDVIITRNLKDYSKAPIKVLSPKQFLEGEESL